MARRGVRDSVGDSPRSRDPPMHRTKLHAALLLMIATPPAAFAQQAARQDVEPEATRDDCRVVESAQPDAQGIYRAVVECTRAPLASAPALKPAPPPPPTPDTDGLDYFSSNGSGDG